MYAQHRALTLYPMISFIDREELSSRNCHWGQGDQDVRTIKHYLCVMHSPWHVAVQACHTYRCLAQGAVDEGYFKQQPWKGAGQARAEVNLHAMTAGVAMLTLYCWLVSLKQQVDQFGSSSLPATLAIVTDKVNHYLGCRYAHAALMLTLYMSGFNREGISTAHHVLVSFKQQESIIGSSRLPAALATVTMK